METMIENIKGYLLSPQKIVDDNVSLFLELQTMLSKREGNPNKYAEYDRDIYDIFHLVFSFYCQRVGGFNRWVNKSTGKVIFAYEVDRHGNHINEEDRIKESELLWGVKSCDKKPVMPIIPPNLNAELSEGWITSWRLLSIVNKPFFGTLDERELMSKDLRNLWQEYNSLGGSVYTMSIEDEKQHKCSLIQLVFNSYKRIGFRFIHRVEYVNWIGKQGENLPIAVALVTSQTLPAQLEPKFIKTPVQRAKLFKQLRDEGYIAEDTAEDCFNWAVGSEVEPTQWKPIQWTLKNPKGVQSHSSALREFLVLLLHGNVCKPTMKPRNLSVKEKEKIKKLFISISNSEINIVKAEPDEYIPETQGFTSHHKNLQNIIYIAKNVKTDIK